MKCFVGNDEVALTTKEFDVLYLIMKNDKRNQSKHSLINLANGCQFETEP